MSESSPENDVEEPQRPIPINLNVHLNCIIIKSSNPAIPSKAIVVPSYNGPLTAEQQNEIIRREREKMAAEADILSADTLLVAAEAESEESGELNSRVTVENGQTSPTSTQTQTNPQTTAQTSSSNPQTTT